jgi:hypothetical protein
MKGAARENDREWDFQTAIGVRIPSAEPRNP